MPIDGYDYAQERLTRTPPPKPRTTPFDAAKKKQKESDEATVRTPSLAYQAMAGCWEDVDNVRGGTQAMRAAGEAYIAQEPQEGNDSYSRRIGRATLSPVYKWLVRAFAAQILRKPIKVSNTGGLSDDEFRQIAGYHPVDDEPGQSVTGHLEDIDQQGSDLQQFAFEWLCEAIHYGHATAEVIYPANDAQTRADEQGLRPHWSLYPAPKVLGDRKQDKTLTRIRLLQHQTEPEGEWGEAWVEQVMVYRLDEAPQWQIWRLDKDDEWTLYGQGEIEFTAGDATLPVVTLYSDRKGRAMPPPLLEVVYLNIRHFQVSADVDHALHIAAVTRHYLFGVAAEDIGEIGAVDEAVCIPNPEARAEWSSPGIEAYEPNNQRLQDLEAQMLRLGLGTMTAQKNVGESAEAKRLDRTQGDSQLAILAQNLQTSLNQCLRLHCAFLGIDPAQAPTAEVNRDFDLTQMDAQMIQALTGVANAGKLSTRTFLELLQRGEIGLRDTWSPEQEINAIEEERTRESAAPVVSNGLVNPLDAIENEQ